MIERNNWKLVNRYLAYRADILQNDPLTVRSGWSCLRHVLEWADAVGFADAFKLRPTFPEYLLHARADGRDEQLSPARMEKILSFARGLFEWLRVEHPSQYRSIKPNWIESLRVPRRVGKGSRLHKRQYWTMEDVLKIINYPTTSLRHKRDKAGLAFVYLSAARGGAFVTMALRSIDIANRKVYQLPEWGVRTKNSKAAITHLLPVPELLEVVKEWDDLVRSVAVSDRVAWYTKLTYDGLRLDGNDIAGMYAPNGRRSAFYQGLKELCWLAGVEWKSPHKIRHGHGVYGRRRAKTIDELKALSQNMMHETLHTTDKTYIEMLEDEVGDVISTFKP